MGTLRLGFGLRFEELYQHKGLERVDRLFQSYLEQSDAGLAERLRQARQQPQALPQREESALLIALGPVLEDFLAELFGLRREVAALAEQHHRLAPLYSAKRLFIQRRAARAYPPEQAADFDGAALTAELESRLGPGFDELAFARAVTTWSTGGAAHAADLELATRYAAWALHAPAGRARHRRGVLFQQPHKLDFDHLVPVETVDQAGTPLLRLPPAAQHSRQGFDLTDPGTDLAGALDQTNYCITCHPLAKDSCSKGLRDKTSGAFHKSPFGVPLTGCPLEVKVSEMNTLKTAGHPLAALAMTAVDNPLSAATGHRICNECMKACIYQKQQPVDIPQVESRILKDVLALPWGFELYSLLTRWNPLNLRRPLPRPESGYKVLVVGLGPAGFTLAHHLLNDGHAVVAIDGLKIEPLAEELSGVRTDGSRVPFRPIEHAEAELFERLGQRAMAGFGGVAEYGITVRWDKNFLKIIRLLLERRAAMTIIGGVRFGGTLTADDAFAAGFDHIALCLGAGKPTVIPMKNGLARGVRQASDFLMSLQLSGAAKAQSLANLEVQLPVVVIGGGLTAIDTATEALAFYPVQVEKFRDRYQLLVAEQGEAAVRQGWSAEQQATADTFLAHAQALQQERAAAQAEGRAPRFNPLLDAWGGATVVYRRRLIDAPSYTLNHEEVALAMAEGIRFAEGLTPVAVDIDGYGHAVALEAKDGAGTKHRLPARTILVAAGTQPNTVLAREEPGRFALDGRYFQACDEDGQPVSPERSPKPAQAQVLMDLHPDGRAISFFGDLHPSFGGNVVKALGGAKQGYPVLSRVLARRPPTPLTPAELAAAMNRELRATVVRVERLAPAIVEVVVQAPRAARRFEPGQFYRLQNFERLAPLVEGTRLAMEGLALTGASVDREQGQVSLIVLEMGGSSSLVQRLQPGEPVILMGPTGTATEIPENETVCLVGGGLGNAVLFSIGQAARARGNRVIYFAGYKQLQDRYKSEQIEAAADRVIWCCDQAPGFTPTRPGDRSFVGTILDAMVADGSGALGPSDLPLASADRLIVIGSDRMMAAIGQARHGVLQPWLKPGHLALGSINSPMQCMMKEICAQCLQLHQDPLTGEETVVFSCVNQDQSLDRVDFASLRQRLGQNAVQERLTALWLERCLERLP